MRGGTRARSARLMRRRFGRIDKRPATVDGQNLTGHKARAIRREELRNFGQFGSARDAIEWRAIYDFFPEAFVLVDGVLEGCAHDRAERYRVDTDAMWRERDGH